MMVCLIEAFAIVLNSLDYLAKGAFCQRQEVSTGVFRETYRCEFMSALSFPCDPGFVQRQTDNTCSGMEYGL